MLITSGLVVQNRANFRGFPSNRERVTTVDRPGNNDGIDNFNTSKKYPEEIIKPGVVFPSQVAYKNIFGKSTTADQRLYFMQHGVFQNVLSQKGKGSKLRRQPYKNRFTQDALMDYMESVALENYRVIDRSLAMEDVTGINAAGYRNPEVIPSEGSVQGPVVEDRSEGSPTVDMHARTPDETMLSPLSAGSLLGLGNVDLGFEAMNSPTAARTPADLTLNIPPGGFGGDVVMNPASGSSFGPLPSPDPSQGALRNRWRAYGFLEEPVTPGNTLPAFSEGSGPSEYRTERGSAYSSRYGSPIAPSYTTEVNTRRRQSERSNASPIESPL